MREYCTYGSVGGAPGNRRFYPEFFYDKTDRMDCKKNKKIFNYYFTKTNRIIDCNHIICMLIFTIESFKLVFILKHSNFHNWALANYFDIF